MCRPSLGSPRGSRSRSSRAITPSSWERFELGAVVALVIAVVMLGVQHRSGQKPTPFDYATLGFFALLVIVGLFANDATVATWVQPVANFALFTIALVSILIGKPFTRQYARQSLPPEVWDSPGFLQGTLQVAWVWVAAFAVMTVSSLITVFQPDLETWTTWVVPIAAFVGAILYTRAVEARGAARAAAASQA